MQTTRQNALRLKYLKYILQDWLISYKHQANGLDLIVVPDHIVPVLEICKNHTPLHFNTLVDIVAIDTHPESSDSSLSCKVVYLLVSVKHNFRISVHVAIPSKQMQLPSVQRVYVGAGWFEREVWDLFGVAFLGNSDLRRILLDYQFIGHALRKDFPVSGYNELFFYDIEARLVYLPLDLAQEAKQFKVSKSWLN